MRKTVLIVEDNPLNMKLFCDLLESRGHDVVRAMDGRSASEAIIARKIDLIVMDIQLPDASGLDLTREIKGNPLYQNVPVLAVTAFALQGDREAMLAAGCDDYLTKPIEIAKFIAAAERLMAAVD